MGGEDTYHELHLLRPHGCCWRCCCCCLCVLAWSWCLCVCGWWGGFRLDTDCGPLLMGGWGGCGKEEYRASPTKRRGGKGNNEPCTGSALPACVRSCVVCGGGGRWEGECRMGGPRNEQGTGGGLVVGEEELEPHLALFFHLPWWCAQPWTRTRRGGRG